MKYAVMIGITLLLSACELGSQYEPPGPAPIIYEGNGCKIYRIYDRDNYRSVYFSDCRGQVTSEMTSGHPAQHYKITTLNAGSCK